MKYKYIIIDESGCPSGSNELTNGMKMQFDSGIIEIIDCENGKLLDNPAANEWMELDAYKD